MSGSTYDLVTVGGGLAASALANSMAGRGYRVLVLERETEFKDRVRGEAMQPWGVGECRELGIYDALMDSCGHESPWFDIHMGPHQLAHRDLVATTPHK